MRVFLVPLGPDRHLPYSEPADTHAHAADTARSSGLVATLVQRYREVIAAAEQSGRESAGRPPDGLKVLGGAPANALLATPENPFLSAARLWRRRSYRK